LQAPKICVQGDEDLPYPFPKAVFSNDEMTMQVPSSMEDFAKVQLFKLEISNVSKR
jgi:hypothetical protein